MNKKLFKGSFNFQGEVITLYTHSKDEKGAFRNLIAQLVRKVEYSGWHLRNYYNGEKDNFIVEEVTK